MARVAGYSRKEQVGGRGEGGRDSREHGVPGTGHFSADWNTWDKVVRGQKPRKFLMAFGLLRTLGLCPEANGSPG